MLERFKKTYNAETKREFIFEGYEFNTGFAKYLIEFIESKLK